MPYESVVKSLIFMPMAISSVALGVIWKFMYAYQPPGRAQTGTVNAILVNWFHHAPWLIVQDPSINNFALIIAAGVGDHRLLHGDPLGGSEGHPGGLARGGQG